MEADETTGSSGPEGGDARTSTRWKIALLLFLATALVGAVARGKIGGAGGSEPGGHGRTQFIAASAGAVSFSGTLDRTAVLLGRDGQVRMELVLKGGTGDDSGHRGVRLPTDLVVILDRSGSMSGEKLEHARAAVRELVGRLGPEDRFALVTYSNDATLLLPLAPVADATREAWLGTIGEIRADGGTNISSGLDLALDTIERARVPGRTSRAILISDGLANQGDPSREGLLGRAGRAARGEYVLTAVGVGADFNEYLMSAIADAGTGNYYYHRGSDDLGAVFAREFEAARATVASSLAVRIEPADGVRVVDAAGYPLESDGSAVVFRPGSLFAGQERRVWVTLTVPNQTVGERELGRFSVAFNDGAERRSLALDETPKVACVQAEDDYYASVDVSSWTRAVVVDGYNRVQEEVAREVKEGRRDAAKKVLDEFRAETAAANQRLQSPQVAAQLRDLSELEKDVDAAFKGENQAARQNEFSKARSAAALDSRRAGSK